MVKEEESILKKQLLGEILIRRNIITKKQLDQALELQKKEKGLIGEILVKLGFAEEIDILVALVVQCNFPYIAIDKYEIDRNIIQLIPKETAHHFQVVPLDRVGDILSIVMADPLDIACKAELHRLTNCKIAPFIATRTEIHKAIERWYGKFS